MDLRKLIAAALKPASPASDLRTELARLPNLIGKAESAAEALEGQRREALLSATDAELAKVDDRVAGANREIERLYALQAELERRLHAAMDEEEQSARREQYATAQEAANEARAALRKYPALARQIVGLLKTVTRAELAVRQANDALPAGAAALPSPEMEMRGREGEPEEILDTEVLPAVWHYTGRHSYMGEVQQQLLESIQSDDGRTGFIETRINSTHDDMRRYEVARFSTKRKVTFRPARSMFRPIALAASVTLPGLEPGSPDIWTPAGNMGGLYGPLGAEAEAVLQHAAALEVAASRPITDPRSGGDVTWRVEDIVPDDKDAAA